MTDLEITKLCAEAMGYKIRGDLSYTLYWSESGSWNYYDPLYNDAQCMALGKANPELFEEAVTMWRRMGMVDSLNLILCQMVASTHE